MKNISFYTRLVKYISYALIPAIGIGFFTKWLFPTFAFANPHIAGLFFSYTFDNYEVMSSSVPTMPLLHRLLAMLIDSGVCILLIAILWLIAAIMKKFEHNEAFSASTVACFAQLSKYALYLAIYTPINRMILSIVITMHNAPGHKVLTASFGSSDLCNIFMFGICMVMTLLLQQATQLQNEQNLTV
jgi:hypothetical protein